jgi:threonine dehydrogenase-like Zn-dependent dehydrogenase
MVEEKLPSIIQATQVLIRIHAVSLNYRDVAMMNGKYPVQVVDRGIPASDCAAEVITVGSGVNDFQPGDHVTVIFDLNNLTGTEDETKALGGDVDGVLRQYAVFDQSVLVHLPKHLSWEEVGFTFHPLSFFWHSWIRENGCMLITICLPGRLYHLRRTNCLARTGHATFQRCCIAPWYVFSQSA